MSYQRVKLINETPWVGIISEEWERAKTIIHWGIRKPKFYWCKQMGNVHGRCWTNGSVIELNQGYKQDNFTDSKFEKEFRLTLRHEFAHIHTGPRHNKEFKTNLERLGGNRYAEISLPEMSVSFAPATRVRQKKETTVVSLLEKRSLTAITNLKRAQTRFKRAKTLLQKHQAKVKYYQRMLIKQKHD